MEEIKITFSELEEAVKQMGKADYEQFLKMNLEELLELARTIFKEPNLNYALVDKTYKKEG